MASAKRDDRRSRCSDKKALLSDAPGSSNIKSKGRGSGSVKRKATRILSVAPRMISPLM
jgi:hypothetical protein